MKHISIRVPWHDNKWNGTICQCPKNNPFCMMLHNISERKDENKEEAYAGKDWKSLKQDQLPACVGENGGFMNEKPYKRIFKHVYAFGETPHTKLLPTTVELQPYSCYGIPFRYLSKDFQEKLNHKYPNMSNDETAPFTTPWVYGRERQFEILNYFKSNIEAGNSLGVFYCTKGNPVDEDAKLIVGIGEITKVLDVQKYETTADYTYPFWDLIFEHGIRTDLKKSKGFLLPYHEYMSLDEDYVKAQTGKSKQEVIDEIKITIPKLGNSQIIFNELSYGCDYVSNHSMLIILNVARKCLESVIKHGLVGGNWKQQILWIDSQIAKVKDMIGPFPAFAEALSAIGVNYAFIIEQDLRNNAYCGVKDNPWEAFDKLMKGELSLPDSVYKSELTHYRILWKNTLSNQRQVLELLSRFEINSEVIKWWFDSPGCYDELLNNPYIISEESLIENYLPVTTEMIDLGIMADPKIQGKWTPKAPSLVESVIDNRRIRSFIISKLVASLSDGDTLISANEIELYIKDCLAVDNHQLPYNYLMSNKEFIEEKTIYLNTDDRCALQLKEYKEIDDYLRKIFKGRASKDVKSPLKEDWNTIVKASIDGYNEANERCRNAVADQVKALEMFCSKRLSVLAGPAGTGKTTVVKAFLKSPQIKAEGTLLLAPTGKARVRLGNMSAGIQALTIAQFLTRQGFFDWATMTPYVPEDAEKRKYCGAKNVIIDECSMLTCKDFYVLMKALDLKNINRIILIGDPFQLPPIGPGRPFADLFNYLKENEDASLKSAITKLRYVVRTINTGDSDILTLASWFSGEKPAKNSDLIFEQVAKGNLNNDLAVYTWNDENDLKYCLKEAIEKELPEEEGKSLSDKIRKSIGLDDVNEALNNPSKVENFQVLSPVKNPVWGTFQINSYFQEWVGINKNFSIEIAPITISALDKVIQLKNERKKSTSKEECQLSNGQIGFVNYANKREKKSTVVFTGLPNKRFSYYSSKSDEADNTIDLAYAITIHKSQGSDFKIVLVVLPKSGRILSRELIYTALTRAREKLILLIQDNISWLIEYSKPQMSVLAKRNSNLFSTSVREDISNIPYVEGLIHTTLKPGLIVRSKSEVIIANMLYERGIDFEYERMIEDNGRRCIPDFTFEDASGDTILWEHLGMLDNPAYRESWEKKRDFYKSIGYIEGVNLFTTVDHENGSIDSTEIAAIVDKLEDLI